MVGSGSAGSGNGAFITCGGKLPSGSHGSSAFEKASLTGSGISCGSGEVGDSSSNTWKSDVLKTGFRGELFFLNPKASP